MLAPLQRKSASDNQLRKMCAVLHKAQLIERYDFDDVSAKCKVRVKGKWTKVEKEELVKLAQDKTEIAEMLRNISG